MNHCNISSGQVLLVVTYHGGMLPPHGRSIARPFMAYAMRFGRRCRYLPATTRANGRVVHELGAR